MTGKESNVGFKDRKYFKHLIEMVSLIYKLHKCGFLLKTTVYACADQGWGYYNGLVHCITFHIKTLFTNHHIHLQQVPLHLDESTPVKYECNST